MVRRLMDLVHRARVIRRAAFPRAKGAKAALVLSETFAAVPPANRGDLIGSDPQGAGAID